MTERCRFSVILLVIVLSFDKVCFKLIPFRSIWDEYRCPNEKKIEVTALLKDGQSQRTVAKTLFRRETIGLHNSQVKLSASVNAIESLVKITIWSQFVNETPLNTLVKLLIKRERLGSMNTRITRMSACEI